MRATAGKRERGDALVTVQRSDVPSIVITSAVSGLFGRYHRSVVDAVLKEEKETDLAVLIEDEQALDCVLRARLLCAIQRLRSLERDI
ncbi:MAG: hypothetical protein RBQ65_00280 [Sphaerochaeta sp.]|nr:hypothetical protein [Sphaerochaeta sp.]